ncbi:MAG: hypothetical protein U1E76_19895 [Planctomycetota bacterium]
MTLAMTFALIGLAVLAALQSWRLELKCFVIWIVFEDLLRKSSGNDVTLYLAKDLILVSIYASFFLRELRAGAGEPWHPDARGARGSGVQLRAGAGLQSELSHPLMAVIGLRMSFIYVPLMLVGYRYLSDERALVGLLRLLTCLGALAAVAGLLQSVLGIELFNPAVAQASDFAAQRQTLDGGRFFRPNSLFLDSSRFGLFLFTNLFLSIGYLFLETARRGRAPWRRITMLNVLLIGSALLFNGHRAALVGVVLAFRRAPVPRAHRAG